MVKENAMIENLQETYNYGWMDEITDGEKDEQIIQQCSYTYTQ